MTTDPVENLPPAPPRRASDRDPSLDREPEAPPVPKKGRDPLEGRRASDVIRAKFPNGDHRTTTVALARKAGATPIDKPAVDRYGRWLPPKRNPLKKENHR